mmetsp:Transcript_100543/g.216970  ORF Transcript_100543/g.216970 Transcript_100543/m.216970 type:complete len:199 (-) Transcript_100543:107-703(-)
MSIKFGSRFLLAIDVINNVPPEKFMLLLNRIFQKLHLKNERLFSDSEEEQLMTVFGLTAENLSLVLDSCCYLFEQAAFQNVGPEPLYEQILEAGVGDLHAKTIGRVWASERAEFIGKLKSRSIGSSALVGTDHHLNLMVGESNLTRLQDPTALFEFTTTTPGGDELTEKTVVEFSHAELFSFFTQLERVQGQLDNLSG